MKEKSEANILFGRRLAALRVEKGLSQEELAAACDLNRTYIGTIERAEKSATVNTIVKLAQGLGVSPKEFF
ncbi:MAG: helix-turn-helix domain-containing protein [Lachnospiraceae bacterium]|nr:helix-turn-helix domain-containing protein [Lachnospiraceae bacterium]